jgi:hypothetical protein|tara:strand:+ start:120 stop:413 length:294 start_codon:yes stop_codon:yes gene_type:complete
MVRTELYTTGGEFTLPDGSDYIGGYHIHFSRGAMVGSFHKVEPHDRLTPVNRTVELFVESIQQSLINENVINATFSTSPLPPTVTGGGSVGGGGGGY